MDEPRDDLRNEDGTVPKWARRVTDTFASNGVQDSKHRDLIDSIEAAEKATNGVFSSKSAGGILDLNAYREMEEEDRAAMNQEQLRRNAEVAQLAALRAEKDRLDEEAARARIKAATDEAMAAHPKRKSDANAPFKLVKVAKKKPVAAKEEDDAGGLEGLLGGYGSDDSNDADADQSAPGAKVPSPPTIQTVPPPPPHQPVGTEAAPDVPVADEYHSDNELDVARAAEARRLRERAEAAEEAEEIAAATTRREDEARARAHVQDIYQQERAIRDEEAAERARTHQSIVPEGFERVPEEEREGARGRNSNERRRGRRSPSSRSRGSESDSPPRRERRHRRSRSRSGSRDPRDDRDRDDIRDRERARRRSRSRGGSGSRERRRRSSPRDAEYWTRHYSEKFGLDDGDTGRGGGKGVDEWAKYYEQKYGLSK